MSKPSKHTFLFQITTTAGIIIDGGAILFIIKARLWCSGDHECLNMLPLKPIFTWTKVFRLASMRHWLKDCWIEGRRAHRRKGGLLHWAPYLGVCWLVRVLLLRVQQLYGQTDGPSALCKYQLEPTRGIRQWTRCRNPPRQVRAPAVRPWNSSHRTWAARLCDGSPLLRWPSQTVSPLGLLWLCGDIRSGTCPLHARIPHLWPGVAAGEKDSQWYKLHMSEKRYITTASPSEGGTELPGGRCSGWVCP